MTDEPNSSDNLADEFRNLGHNLLNIVQTAWDSPERKRLQEEILSGLDEAGSAIKREADQFREGPTGQQLKNDVERLGEQLRSSETQEKVRQEVLSALRTLNSELQKVAEQWTRTTESGEEGQSADNESHESPSAPQG